MAPSNRRRVHVLPPNAHLSPRARTFNTRTHAHACMHERMHTLRNHQFSRNSWQIHFEETKDFENQEKIRQSVTKSTLFSLGYWESNNIINNQISLCTSSPPHCAHLGTWLATNAAAARPLEPLESQAACTENCVYECMQTAQLTPQVHVSSRRVPFSCFLIERRSSKAQTNRASSQRALVELSSPVHLLNVRRSFAFWRNCVVVTNNFEKTWFRKNCASSSDVIKSARDAICHNFLSLASFKLPI